MDAASSKPSAVTAGLERLRIAARRYLVLTGVLRMCALLFVLFAGQLLLDRWLRLATDQRFVLDLLVVAGALMGVVRFLLPTLLVPLDDVRLARLVDRAHPELHDAVVTAIEFSRPGINPKSNSPELVAEVLRDVSQAAERISFLRVLDHAGAKRRVQRLALGGFVMVLVAVFWTSGLSIWFQRNWMLRDIPWPQATYLRPVGFVDGVRPAPRGEALQLVIENSGRVPSTARLEWQNESGQKGEAALTQIGAVQTAGEVSARWEVDLGPLREPLRFRLIGGDERSPEYLVQALDRPQVVKLTAVVTPPAYTGLSPATIEGSTALEVLARSTLEVTAQLNKPVTSAEMRATDGVVGETSQPDPDVLRWNWDNPASGSYQFALQDRNAWNNRRPVRLNIKVVPDMPPQVELDLPGVGEQITPQVALQTIVQARDAYGLTEVKTWVQRNEEPPLELPDNLEPGAREHRQTLPVVTERLGLRPGDRLQVWSRATDNDPAGPNVTEVTPVVLEVLSRQDFLAVLAQREQELRQEFERLLSAQRGVQDLLARLIPEMSASPTPSPSQTQQIAALVRRQATHAARVLEVSQRFAEVLAEMQQNQVSRATDERRIAEGIVQPLAKLGEERFPTASQALEALREQVTPETVEAVSDQQTAVLRSMEAVLANMLEWEGYREAVALLTELIELQEAVRGETQAALETQLDDILDLEEFMDPEPASADDPATP